jgi:hypothetical protein
MSIYHKIRVNWNLRNWYLLYDEENAFIHKKNQEAKFIRCINTVTIKIVKTEFMVFVSCYYRADLSVLS